MAEQPHGWRHHQMAKGVATVTPNFFFFLMFLILQKLFFKFL
jgi:hypothetical protein